LFQKGKEFPVYSLTASNVKQCLEQIHAHLNAHDLFYGHGTNNPWDEACWLLEAVLRQHGIGEFSELSSIKQVHLDEVSAILSRRIEEKKPLAYLINEAWFAGVPFYVDERVLVPRSPIAELIMNRFEPLLRKSPRRILDLCTGGGCIGIACALAFPEAQVDLADLSTEALEVASKNIEKHKLKDRVAIIHSDLFTSISNDYDLIVTNPPYVSQQEYDDLPEEYHNEPELGLISSDNGLDIPTQILLESANYLADDGVLILEVGYSWQALAQEFPLLPFLWLEFELGGEGVCMLRKQQLQQ
jgi:ribosomal protein L3 glutamine methyltransferase